MRLSTYFDTVEWQCRDGTPVPGKYMVNVQRQHDAQLYPLRVKLGKPIRITSGYRTPEWNQGKGVLHSQHLVAAAVDIVVPGVPVEDLRTLVYQMIRDGEIMDGGVGTYLPRPGRRLGWLHIDVGPVGRRWRG